LIFSHTSVDPFTPQFRINAIGAEEKRKSNQNKVTTKTTALVGFLPHNDSRMLRTWSTFQLDAIIVMIAGLVGTGH